MIDISTDMGVHRPYPTDRLLKGTSRRTDDLHVPKRPRTNTATLHAPASRGNAWGLEMLAALLATFTAIAWIAERRFVPSGTARDLFGIVAICSVPLVASHLALSLRHRVDIGQRGAAGWTFV